jgi:Protein of unknown function (DUF3352)
MKFRSFLTGLAAIAVSLFLAGLFGFAWILGQSPLSLLKGVEGAPSAAMFIPRQAPLVASLLVNPDRLETLRQVVANPRDRAETRTEFDQFKQGVLGSTELDYQRDVQPWLGDEMTAAITTLDVDRDDSNGKEAGYLLVLSTKDPARSREFLQLFWQKRAIAGTDLAFDPFKGTKIIYGKVSQENVPLTLASAVVGNRYVLFANSPKVLRDAMTNVQAAELNLANSNPYQSAIASLKQGKIGLIFLNTPQLATLTKQNFSKIGETVAIALGLDRQGLLAETAFLGNPSKAASAATLSEAVGALKYIPALSSLVASGTNLDQMWSGLSETIPFVNQPLEVLQKDWHIDLVKDILSQVKGEYALGLLPREVNPAKKSEPKTQILDWVFVLDKSSSEAQNAIAHLDEIAKAQSMSTGSLKLSDQNVQVWTRLSTESLIKRDSISVEAKVVGAHTAIDQYEIFATSIEAMNAVLSGKDAIASSNQFERAIAPLQTPNSGYLYMDWIAVQPILEKQFPFLRIVELTGKPLFDHLKSITVSNYGNQSDIQRGGAFIQLD